MHKQRPFRPEADRLHGHLGAEKVRESGEDRRSMRNDLGPLAAIVRPQAKDPVVQAHPDDENNRCEASRVVAKGNRQQRQHPRAGGLGNPSRSEGDHAERVPHLHGRLFHGPS